MTDKIDNEQLTEAVQYALEQMLNASEPQNDFDRMVAKIEFQEHIKAHLRENSSLPEDLIKTIRIYEGPVG